ncbi:glutaminyl-peptide cyclotransferase [Paragonimus westermani]|uniref:glutaminyl-peptide cyclotransferase n=1 Tax=Paragonimus westermani TaxID=34504 RepID=A0A5J4NTB1_9TREM|nr:glutaminyl-peptide cyclotransferase [Paragonimus westermani]
MPLFSCVPLMVTLSGFLVNMCYIECFGSGYTRPYQLHTLSITQLHTISQYNTVADLRDIFANINIFRQVDTPSHLLVGSYIANYLSLRGWLVDWDNFTQSTVSGEKTFRNIIATLPPPHDEYLVLACHYDSKAIDGFYGSTDSAMPCSIMLKVADSITSDVLTQKFSSVGIRLIFFDGEEAFRDWSSTDSLYGSRHLAEMWEKEGSDGRTELSKIVSLTYLLDKLLLAVQLCGPLKLLVLLDLLGASNPVIPNYHSGNAMAYHALLNLENVMSSAGLLLGVRKNDHKYFGSRSDGLIQDDHIPFLYRENVMSSAGLLLGVRKNDHKYFGSRSDGLIQDDHIPFLYRG